MPHFHFVLDAYGVNEESADNLMTINELLVQLGEQLDIKPIMPPFLLPYYYCSDTEDEGISAFCICQGGHVTIHTFPKRSCYFADILTDEFFQKEQAMNIFNQSIFASKISSSIIDRRYACSIPRLELNTETDFGPHYLINVENCDMTMDSIFTWLDTIAEKVNMLPICRPYVMLDNAKNPQYISGLLIVAQSHVAVHYDIKERTACIDIFSCSFLQPEAIDKVLKDSFGENVNYHLFIRGSKYKYNIEKKEIRDEKHFMWRKRQ